MGYRKTFNLSQSAKSLADFIAEYVNADCWAVTQTTDTVKVIFNGYGGRATDSARDEFINGLQAHPDMSSVFGSGQGPSALDIYMFCDDSWRLHVYREGDIVTLNYLVSSGYENRFGLTCP